jgi:hypothetical protein
MKILIRIALLLMVSALMYTLFTGSSCDKATEPQEEEEATLTGSWRMANITIKDTPVGNLTMTASAFLGMSGTGATTSTLQFNEDGTCATITTYDDGSEESVPGTYTVEGDQLAITGAGIDATVPYTLTSTTLTITIIMAIDFNSDGELEDFAIDMTYNKI